MFVNNFKVSMSFYNVLIKVDLLNFFSLEKATRKKRKEKATRKGLKKEIFAYLQTYNLAVICI